MSKDCKFLLKAYLLHSYLSIVIKICKIKSWPIYNNLFFFLDSCAFWKNAQNGTGKINGWQRRNDKQQKRLRNRIENVVWCYQESISTKPFPNNWKFQKSARKGKLLNGNFIFDNSLFKNMHFWKYYWLL